MSPGGKGTCSVRPFLSLVLFGVWLSGIATQGSAQSPSPETGATLFPGGGFVSYGSDFIFRRPTQKSDKVQLIPSIRPTLAYDGTIAFGWGFRRDFQFTALVPVSTRRLDLPDADPQGMARGTGLGDVLLLVKHRLVRRDSKRGTTQISVAVGPKLPTGRTNLRDEVGNLLPAALQPGSGSTDLFANLNGTYTGLFNIKRLVADVTFTYLHRTEGIQHTRLGNFSEARLWVSYRPYQTKSVGKEWFIGPALTWHHFGNDFRNGLRDPLSGEDNLLLGALTYFSPHAGLTLWLGAEFPVAQNNNGMPLEVSRRITFGITRQFSLRH
jgi:hypothetical protein